MRLIDAAAAKERFEKIFCGNCKSYNGVGVECPLYCRYTCAFSLMNNDELKQVYDIVYDAEGNIKPDALVKEYKFKTVRDLLNALHMLPMDAQLSDEFGNTLGVVIVEDGKIKLARSSWNILERREYTSPPLEK